MISKSNDEKTQFEVLTLLKWETLCWSFLVIDPSLAPFFAEVADLISSEEVNMAKTRQTNLSNAYKSIKSPNMPKIPSAFFAKPASYVLHIYLSIVGWRPSKHRQKLTNLNCVYPDYSVFHTTSPSLPSQLRLPTAPGQYCKVSAEHVPLQNRQWVPCIDKCHGGKGMEAKDDFGITNHLRSQSTMQIPHTVKLYRKVTNETVSSWYPVWYPWTYARYKYVYIYVNLDHLSMCEHVASILHLFAKPQKWDSILEVQGAHMYGLHSLMPSPWKHPPKTHQETMPSAKFAG